MRRRHAQQEKRLVRLHLVDAQSSFEGVLLAVEAGHYRLANPSMIDGNETVQLDGESWIPSGRVLFVQVLS